MGREVDIPLVGGPNFPKKKLKFKSFKKFQNLKIKKKYIKFQNSKISLDFKISIIFQNFNIYIILKNDETIVTYFVE